MEDALRQPLPLYNDSFLPYPLPLSSLIDPRLPHMGLMGNEIPMVSIVEVEPKLLEMPTPAALRANEIVIHCFQAMSEQLYAFCAYFQRIQTVRVKWTPYNGIWAPMTLLGISPWVCFSLLLLLRHFFVRFLLAIFQRYFGLFIH